MNRPTLHRNRVSPEEGIPKPSVWERGENQLTARTGGGGALTLEGTISEPATVLVGGPVAAGGQVAEVWKTGANTYGFRATVTLAVGTNTVPITATDANNNTTTSQAVLHTAGASIPALSYDENGNTLSDGTRVYEWDAENQMVAINYAGTGNRTEFTYDGQGRRVRIVEVEGGVVTSSRSFVWSGMDICEERDNGNAVVKRFYPQGRQTLNPQLSTTNSSYYTRDHLGSIRQLVGATGTVQARYSYDLYGNLDLNGSGAPDFAYTGHFHHARSGLHLAPYRAYSAELGRWLSRDPLEDAEFLPEGPNLYAYVGNDPMNWIDPTGNAEDKFVPDASKHGGPHIDRYQGNKNVGRYRPDGSGIPHKGKLPPKIPNSLMPKFLGACEKLANRLSLWMLFFGFSYEAAFPTPETHNPYPYGA